MVVGGLKVSATGMVCGLLEAPDAATTIAVLYVPAANPVVDTLALTESTSVVVVPEAMLSPSHAADSVKDHVNVPPVGFETETGLASGGGPAAVPEKLRLIGLSWMLGVGPVWLPAMKSVTGTDVICVLFLLS